MEPPVRVVRVAQRSATGGAHCDTLQSSGRQFMDGTKKSRSLVENRGILNGATCQSRTDDLMITNQLLYQLS